MDPYNPASIFDGSVPPRAQLAILRSTVVNYAEAHYLTRERFDRFSRHDVLPHIRRAYIDQGLRAVAVAQRLRGGADAALNAAGNSYHAEIVAGRTVLTASAVDSPDQMVRHAIFRETLARNPQRALPGLEPAAPAATANLYGIIVYGPGDRRGDPRLPGFVRVVFPDPSCSIYVGDPVDLMARFAPQYEELVLRIRRGDRLA